MTDCTQTHPDDAPVKVQPPPKKKRPRVERLLILLMAALGVLSLLLAAAEVTSQDGYQTSKKRILEAYSQWEAGQRGELTLHEILPLVHGWPRRIEEQDSYGTIIRFRWWSLFRNYALRIEVDSDGYLQPGQSATIVDSSTAERAGPIRRSVKPHDLSRLDALTHSGAAAPGTAGGALHELLSPPQAIPRGHLFRELARQAVLLTVREGFGIPVRDAALGELVSDGDGSSLLTTVATLNVDGGVQVTIARLTAGRPQCLGERRFLLADEQSIEEVAFRLERLSRGGFVTILKDAGYQVAPPRTRDDGDVLPVVLEALSHADLPSQFCAVRTLHSRLRETSSPELLGALVRGYANLGLLTEPHWSPVHKTFKARSLLYAERLMHTFPRNGWSLWNRAYARALAGLHRSALEDVAAARNLADPSGAVPPDWIAVIEAYCTFNRQQLAELRTGGASRLADHLALRLAARSDSADELRKTAVDVLSHDPHSSAALRMLCEVEPIDSRSETAARSIAALDRALNRRWAMLVIPVQSPPGEEATTAVRLAERRRVLQEFRAHTASGKDQDEPSCAALAELLLEASWLQRLALRRGMERNDLPADEAGAWHTLLAGHAFARYLELKEDDGAPDFAAGLRRQQLDLSAWPLVEDVRSRQLPEADELWEAMLVNSDEIYRDLALRRRLATPDGRLNDLAALRSVSPESPEAISLRLREDEDEIGRHGAAWEAKYANDVIVLRALASAHMGSGRNADAERCLKRVVELAPNWSSFRTLASFYDTTGNEANRMRTMEAALQTNLEGADRGRFSVELAQNALQQGQWEQAASHALTALSYSENDALPVAIEAYQRLGKWADAEQLTRQLPSDSAWRTLEWYVWCRRTGHGDVDAARTAGQRFLEQIQSDPTDHFQERYATYLLLQGDPAAAFEVLQARFKAERNPRIGLLAAVIADDLSDSGQRDALVQELISLGLVQDNWLSDCLYYFRKHFLADGSNPTDDPAATAWYIRRLSTVVHPEAVLYFLGKRLVRCGRVERATEYLQMAAQSPLRGRPACILAEVELRRLGITPGPRRTSLFDPAVARALQQLNSALTRMRHSQFDAALDILHQMIQSAAQLVDGYVARATVYTWQGELKRAWQDLQRCSELLPENNEIDLFRARVLEFQDEHERAIELYEQILRRDPRSGVAHVNLAYLRASCVDERYRNPSDALAHARLALECNDIDTTGARSVLAVALAATGDFEHAVAAVDECLATALPRDVPVYETRREMFLKREPYVRKPGWWKGR